MADTIKLRRGTAATWTANNPTLAAGELGIETDTRLFKFGTGVTAWNDLPYASAGSSTLHAGSATLASGSVTILASWVTADTVIVVTPQTDDASARSLYVDPTNIVAATSFDISSSDGSDTRTAFWMATEPTEPVESGMALQADGSGGDSYLQKDLGTPQTEVWLTFDLSFDAAALAFWVSGSGSAYLASIDTSDPTNPVVVWFINTGPVWETDVFGGASYGSPAPVATTWQHLEYHYRYSDGLVEFYVGGGLVHTDNITVDHLQDIQFIRIGQNFAYSDPAEANVFYKNIKIGSSREGTEFLSEDFSGDLSAWSVVGACTIVADPY